MTFTGDQIDANEALACGLVSRVVPDEQLMPTALELASRIAANPNWAVRTSTRLMKEGRNLRMQEVLADARRRRRRSPTQRPWSIAPLWINLPASAKLSTNLH